MSWSRRSLLAALPAITACGFTPVYAPGGAGDILSGQVRVETPESEEGYLLGRALETRLGRSATGTYRLNVLPKTEAQGQAVNAAGDILRYSMVGEASYSLTQALTGQVISAGKVDNFTGYSATGSTVETLAGETDARERLMTLLAEQIIDRLLSIEGLT